MAMGRRKQREKQEGLWIAHTELRRLRDIFLSAAERVAGGESFDEFVEDRCAKFYAANYGRPSLTPGIYFRSLLIGYFEGIGAERGIAIPKKLICLRYTSTTNRPLCTSSITVIRS
jgi:transposase